jgi:two-component system, cell cycle response regulator DivK
MNAFPFVLYVEDDLPSREIMELLLVGDMELSRVTIFEDSADFMDRVRKLNSKPEVILLDIHVRPYNGFEMLHNLRQSADFRDTPVVTLTASVMNEEIQQLRDAGFNGVIAKPIDVDTFPSILKRILNGESIWSISS